MDFKFGESKFCINIFFLLIHLNCHHSSPIFLIKLIKWEMKWCRFWSTKESQPPRWNKWNMEIAVAKPGLVPGKKLKLFLFRNSPERKIVPPLSTVLSTMLWSLFLCQVLQDILLFTSRVQNGAWSIPKMGEEAWRKGDLGQSCCRTLPVVGDIYCCWVYDWCCWPGESRETEELPLRQEEGKDMTQHGLHLQRPWREILPGLYLHPWPGLGRL